MMSKTSIIKGLKKISAVTGDLITALKAKKLIDLEPEMNQFKRFRKLLKRDMYEIESRLSKGEAVDPEHIKMIRAFIEHSRIIQRIYEKNFYRNI